MRESHDIENYHQPQKGDCHTPPWSKPPIRTMLSIELTSWQPSLPTPESYRSQISGAENAVMR